ncbi:MAG TPA: substrate-binding domain-containing protein, partial [Candidatus Methylacidiphilales bacterium]
MQAFPRWFAAHRPDAVISPHISGYEWLARLKAAVPEEVGFVHLDLEPGQTRLSGIDQRPEAIGATALDLLTDQLNRNERGVPKDPKLVLIEPSWIDGGTTRKPAAGEAEGRAAAPALPPAKPGAKASAPANAKPKAKPVRRPR